MNEDGEISQFDEDEDASGKHVGGESNRDLCDTSRFSMLNSTREYLKIETTQESEKENIESDEKSISPSELSKTSSNSTLTKSPTQNQESKIKINYKPPVQNGNSTFSLKSARIGNMTQNLSSSSSLISNEEQTPSKSLAQSEFELKDKQIKQLEERIKKLDGEVVYLKKENKEQNEKIIQF